MEEVTEIKQGENDFGLNHFILWCKNWYALTPKFHKKYIENSEEHLFETLKRVLYLDDYFVYDKSDIINILLNNLERYNEWAIKNKKKYLSASQIIRNINHNMNISYNELSYFECVVYAIREFFAFDNLVELYTPIYSKNLFKLGLISPTLKNGETYKERNKYVRRYKFERTREYKENLKKRIERYLEYKR